MSGMVAEMIDKRLRIQRFLLLIILLMSTIPMMVFLVFYVVAYFGAVTGLYNVEQSLTGVRL